VPTRSKKTHDNSVLCPGPALDLGSSLLTLAAAVALALGTSSSRPERTPIDRLLLAILRSQGRYQEYSFPRLFVPWNIRSLDRSFHETFVPWNFRSRYPGPFLPRTVRIGGGSIYEVGGPDAKRRRCQRDGLIERTGSETFVNFSS